MISFGWRKLSTRATVAYRLDDGGRLLMRSRGGPPFRSIRARDGAGGFADFSIDSRGLTWTRVDSESWELRTRGEPATAIRMESLWGDAVSRAVEGTPLDRAIVLAMIAAETGFLPGPDEHGLVKAPRTEPGYPDRTGEDDFGSEARDAIDWRQSGGMHSSHGLLQTLIGTAVSVRPDLFANVPVSRYREVLWDPQNSIAIAVATILTLVRQVDPTMSMIGDPLAVRMTYAGSYGHATDANRWGVGPLYDELVPTGFVGYFNDAASLAVSNAVSNASSPTVFASPVAHTTSTPQAASLAPWIFGTAALVSAAALAYAATRARPPV